MRGRYRFDPTYGLDRHIADAITEHRQQQMIDNRPGFDITSVAQRMTVSKPAIHHWETGRCYPGTLEGWRVWANAVGLDFKVELTPLKQPKGHVPDYVI